MLKIAVDAMGGDYAPTSEVEGAVEAARDLDVGIFLSGDLSRFRPNLTSIAERAP